LRFARPDSAAWLTGGAVLRCNEAEIKVGCKRNRPLLVGGIDLCLDLVARLRLSGGLLIATVQLRVRGGFLSLVMRSLDVRRIVGMGSFVGSPGIVRRILLPLAFAFAEGVDAPWLRA
jgi:hypothetical protein